MPGNRIVLFIAGGLALAGTAGAFAVGASTPSTALSSSGHTATTVDFLSDLPDLDVPEAVTTTTSITAATTTTVAPVTTTTVAPVTPTSVRPVATTTVTPTTAPGAKKAVIDSIVNHYSAAVDYGIGSDDSTAHWVLAPNATAGPATIVIGEHDSSGMHRVDMPSCGRGDQDNYFTAGHHYTIEIVDNGLPDGCGEGIPGFWSVLRDITAGTSKIV